MISGHIDHRHEWLNVPLAPIDVGEEVVADIPKHDCDIRTRNVSKILTLQDLFLGEMKIGNMPNAHLDVGSLMTREISAASAAYDKIRIKPRPQGPIGNQVVPRPRRVGCR